MPQMQPHHRAANATMASCRKCINGIVPQMQPHHRAANATMASCRKCNQWPGLRVTFHNGDYWQTMRHGAGWRRPGAGARAWRRPGAGARAWRRLGAALEPGAAQVLALEPGAAEVLVWPTAPPRCWCGLRRRRGAGAMFPNRRRTSRAKQNATKFQKYLLRTQ